MSTTPESRPLSPLPDYIASAVPNPPTNRAAWYKNTAPTYAGIFLWFVFWQDVVVAPTPGGGLAAGVGVALLGLVLAAAICHFGFYLVPGLLGLKTGLPLYIVGTSTFGARGGFLMPGFLMGLLQFGWLGVNTYFSSLMLSQLIPLDARILMVFWGILAAFVGLKGIQYVAGVATYLPLIPLVILLVMFARTIGGVGSFDPQALIALQSEPASVAPSAAAAIEAAVPSTDGEPAELGPATPKTAEEAAPAVVDTDATAATGGSAAPLSTFGVLAFLLTYVVGFFATAGAAGVDFGMNNRDERDVQMGGLVGIALMAILTGGLSLLIVAGIYGTETLREQALAAGDGNVILNSTALIPVVLGENLSRWLMALLAVSAFPSACFASFIAANSFKTTLPKVNPFVSVGVGAAISIALAVSGLAGQVVPVFVIIGASFGPICGALMVDYLLAGSRWSGPRAGFNPAGWIAWALGFLVGILPNLHAWNPSIPNVPAAPVLAFLVGAVVYFLCAKLGLLTPVLPMPAQSATATGPAPEPA